MTERDGEHYHPTRPSRDVVGTAGSVLGGIGERREFRVGPLRVSGRRRRPTGEKAPLPKELRASGWFWLIMGVGLAVLWISIFAFPETTNWWTDRDLTVLRWFQDRRTDFLTEVADAVHAVGSQWFIRPLRWGTIAVLIIFKRWRHLLGFLAVLIIVAIIVSSLEIAVARARPLVDVIGPWAGYSHPSGPVAGLSVTLALMGMTLLPKGRWRSRWFTLAEVLVIALGLARIYLGVDHPSDVWTVAILGFAIATVFFKLFVPESVFPVRYTRGTTAHLDVTGARGVAITKALHDQLGLNVKRVEPFGLEGSGGSTPLRLTVATGDRRVPELDLFAKLYSQTHLRSDRWYKFGRTILYGSLEDEVKFSSVRRLVEYEDYILLRMKEAGLPSAESYGIVEITPEREYLIVTEFLLGAEELGDAIVDDDIIEQGLLMIRQMWDAGLAHRDIKPANVMVQDRKVYLIDVAFATIRPSPWRQAVDLANMMIILGLRHDPEHVYQEAMKLFSEDDIAEAFAATRGITMPSQSRSANKALVKGGGSDLVETFRSMAPPSDPISVQRWGRRRILLTLAAALGALMFVSLIIENLTGAGFV